MNPQFQTQLQLQKVTQHTNDIWNRVLFSLELMEYALDEKEYPEHYDIDKILLDLPPGQLRDDAVAGFRTKDFGERDSLIQLQVRAFRRGIKNTDADASSEMPWLLSDFLEWYAGRISAKWSKVDEYSLAIAKALLVKDFKEVSAAMPEMPDDEDENQHDINQTIHTLGVAAHLADNREKFVEENMADIDGKLVEKFTHERGSVADGFFSLNRLWATPQSTINQQEAASTAFEIVQSLSKTEMSSI